MTKKTAAFYLGQKLGNLIVRAKVPDDKKPSSLNLKRRWRVECQCSLKSTLTVPEYYLLRKGNPKVNCGSCPELVTLETKFNREYRIWLMMHVRTENPKHEAYHRYGGRGIRVCAEWHKSLPENAGFKAFLAFIGPAPSLEYSVDRVDNDCGYQPYHPTRVDAEGKPRRQVKWSTSVEQRANQGSSNTGAT